MRKLMIGQEPEPEIDITTAKQMLDNVLDVCNYEHSTVPIEVLSSYSRYRRERYALQNGLIIAMLVLFLLLPLLFLAPSVDLREAEPGDATRLFFHVDSLIPVQSVNATLNGKAVPVYDSGFGNYLIQPGANGELTVSATLYNRQTTAAAMTISTVDSTAPVYTACIAADDKLMLYFADDMSGIDEQGIYATADDGETLVSALWDEELGCVEIDYPEGFTHLYVPDHAGNTVHLVLTPQS